MTTVREVNKALQNLGTETRIFRGNGYYYFYDGDAERWPQCSIYTNSITNWSVQMVLDEYRSLKEAYESI